MHGREVLEMERDYARAQMPASKIGNAVLTLIAWSGVNFMSQKFRGIPPGGILLLTLIDSFLHFFGSVYVYSQVLRKQLF